MRRIWHHIAAAALLLAPLTGPALAEGSSLIRLTDRDDLFGWEAVGRVEIGRGKLLHRCFNRAQSGANGGALRF